MLPHAGVNLLVSLQQPSPCFCEHSPVPGWLTMWWHHQRLHQHRACSMWHSPGQGWQWVNAGSAHPYRKLMRQPTTRGHALLSKAACACWPKETGFGAVLKLSQSCHRLFSACTPMLALTDACVCACCVFEARGHWLICRWLGGIGFRATGRLLRV